MGEWVYGQDLLCSSDIFEDMFVCVCEGAEVRWVLLFSGRHPGEVSLVRCSAVQSSVTQ